MSVFGSFTYGSGVVYGSGDSARIVFVARNLLRVEFIADVIVNDALYDPTNYTIVNDDSSEEIGVRSVVQYQDDRTVVDHVLLLTDRHTADQVYTLTVSNLTSRAGVTLGTLTTAPRTNTNTKVDSILASVPSFLDRRPGSVVASLLTAVGLEDERIGGAVRERIGAG